MAAPPLATITAGSTGESNSTHSSHCLLLLLPVLKSADPVAWCVIVLFCLLPGWLVFTRSWLLPRRISDSRQFQSAKEIEIAFGIFLLALTWLLSILHTQVPILRHVQGKAPHTLSPILLVELGVGLLTIPLALSLRKSIVRFELARLRAWSERNIREACPDTTTLLRQSRVRTRLFTTWTIILGSWLFDTWMKSYVLSNENPAHSIALVTILFCTWISNIGVLGWLTEAVFELRSSAESMEFLTSLPDLAKRDRNEAWADLLDHWNTYRFSRCIQCIPDAFVRKDRPMTDQEPLLGAA